MYLSRIELFGFKSFAQKTVIDFSSGVTCVVGPNGCGKTNILDAVRWVLGEQRSTALRSDRMENVIFNGSRHRRPMGMSEISLIIQNSRDILPVEYGEIVLTRRLYRAGESEYLMNRAPCRLKDITDLFMDTGMGPGSYSVIELKMVEELLSDKPEERRHLFEEAAGITKYKHRRRMALRRLEETRGHILRLEDILGEAERQVNQLRRQVRRTERYREYSGELKELEIRLARVEFDQYRRRLEPLQERLAEDRGKLKRMDLDLVRREARGAELERRIIAAENRQADSEEALRLRYEDCRRIEEELLVNRERGAALERELERMRTESEDLEPRIAASRESLLEAERGIRRSSEQSAKLKERADRAATEAESAAADLARASDEAAAARDKVLEVLGRLSLKRSEQARVAAGIESAQRQLGELREQESRMREEREERLGRRGELQGRQELALASRREHEQAREGGSRELERGLERLREARQLEHELAAELKAARDRRRLIEGLLSRFEGVPGGARAVLAAGVEGIVDTLGNLIHADPEHLAATEAAVGEAAGWLVAEDRAAVEAASEVLAEAEQGGCTFVVLSGLEARSVADAPVEVPAGCRSLASLLKVTDRFRPLVEHLLRNCWLCDNIDEAAAGELPPGSLCVTCEGNWFRPPAVWRRGPGAGSGESHLGLRYRLESLAGEVEDFGERGAAAARAREDVEVEVRGLEARLKGAGEKLERADLECRQCEMELSRLDFEEERCSRDEKTRRGLAAEIDDRLARETALERGLKVEIGDLEVEQDGAGGDAESAARLLERRQEQHRRASESGAAARQAAAEQRIRVESEEQERDRLASFIDEGTAKLQGLAGELEQGSARWKELGARREELEQQRLLADEARERGQRDLDQRKAEHQELGDSRREHKREETGLREQREALLKSTHDGELEVSEIRIQLENLKRRIAEEYGLELKPAEDEDPRTEPRDFDPQAARERVAELREAIRRLGPVNLLAIDEYETEKERLDFQRKQLGDLLEAEALLKETIQRINRVARELFEDCFRKIRENFDYLFRKLFKDGRADLGLGEDDPLESDILVSATPSGKRIQNLNLMSGGEKTMTAIALLFAIYMVKPSPFCILDEVDAPLDDVNIARFNKLIQEFSEMTQFIIITHNKKTMGYADQLHGVTMAEEGVSSMVSVQLSL